MIIYKVVKIVGAFEEICLGLYLKEEKARERFNQELNLLRTIPSKYTLINKNDNFVVYLFDNICEGRICIEEENIIE